MNKKWFMLPIGIGAVALVTFVGGSLVKWLWNWLMPMLFGLPEVTFWQAVGILALSRILFGGFGMGGDRGRRWDHHMSAEERARLRQRMRDRGETGEKPGEGEEISAGPASP
jgi:hypothetical protein